MKLWLRTQNQERLCEIDCISYSAINSTINKNDLLGELTSETQTIHSLISRGINLGRYSTKERCFEILDELQTIIEKGKNSETVIYKMPQE